MTEAGPSDAAQSSGEAALAGAVSTAAAQPAGLSDEQKQAQLIASERQYQQGVQAIRDNRLEDAVELFGKCLETRVATFGDQAAECGGAYYRYGAALFYKAQDEADVFGDNLQDAAEKHDAQDDDHASADEAGPSSGAGPSGGDVAGPSGLSANGSSDAADAPAADGAAEPEAEQTDMQLAWSMLEVAKLIFSRDRAANALDLADVHMLLGDLSAENEAFAEALEDYRLALELLSSHLPEGQQPPVRRLAELHYKASLALQFLHKAAPAKEHTETAVRLVQGRIAELEARPTAGDGGAAPAPATAAPGVAAPAAADEPADTAAAAAPATPSVPATNPGAGPDAAAAAVTGEEADAEAAHPASAAAAGAGAGGAADPAAGSSGTAPGKSAAAKEVQALRDSLEGLQERLEELNALIAEEAATRQQLRAAFASIAGAGAAAPSAGRAAAAADPSAHSSGGGGAASSGSGFSKPAGASATGAVRDLGVVGRGQKRITLAPVPAAGGGGAAAAAGSAAAAAGSAAAPKRRRLDDIMGGGETSGFGAPAATGKAHQPTASRANLAGAAAASDAGAGSAGAGAPAVSGPQLQPSIQPGSGAALAASQGSAALPAFLRPAAVAAAYGGSSGCSAANGNVGKGGTGENGAAGDAR